MKNKRKILFLLLICLTTLVTILSGCKGGDKNTSETPTVKPNATSTPAGTGTTVTPQPTTAATPEPETTNVPLTGDQLGKPQADSKILFEDQFKDNLPQPETIFRFTKAHEIVDEQLYLSTYGGVPVEYAETYAPDIYGEVKDNINQIEYFITFKTEHQHAENSYWMAAFVGIRVYEPTGGDYRPNDPDSGLYVAFTQHNKAVLYHGNHESTGKKWEVGVVSVNLPKGFKDMQTLAIVDTGNKVFYYTEDAGNYTLFLSVDLSGDKIKAYDASGAMIYEADNNLKDNPGGYFKVFNHFGRTVIDSVVIKER